MTDNARDPAAYAADIDAARERMIALAGHCSEQEWRAAPLDGDPRPVAVVVDHVADAYDYLAGWIRQIVVGQQVEVDNDLAAGDGRVQRLAQIAARHADEHRAEIEAALAAHGLRPG